MRELAAIRPTSRSGSLCRTSRSTAAPSTAIEIGRDVQAAEDGRPTFVLLGVHHAREWPSGELAMEFAYDLVKNYGSDPRITSLVNRSRVVVVPVVNVDGFELSRTDGGARRPARGRRRRHRLDPGHPRQRLQAQELPPRRRPGHPRRHLPGRQRDQPRRLRHRRRPEPQLRRLLGRPRGLGRVRRPDLPRRRPVLRARDPERARPGQQPPGHHDDLQPHLLQPGAAAQRRAPRHDRPRRAARSATPRTRPG